MSLKTLMINKLFVKSFPITSRHAAANHTVFSHCNLVLKINSYLLLVL